ncbi:MAG TPA: hypothetical protein VL984_07050 [Acidimicrobiales bacterium]|nr:hypothetical protein [Acidimicrobiales bacterium]
MDDDEISYMALQKGTPVLSSSGTEFGNVEHVLQVPELDLFDGIVVKPHHGGHGTHGVHFVDRDQIRRITRTAVFTELTDEQAAQLPRPMAPPVERLDVYADEGPSLTARFGRLFHRPHWVEQDK